MMQSQKQKSASSKKYMHTPRDERKSNLKTQQNTTHLRTKVNQTISNDSDRGVDRASHQSLKSKNNNTLENMSIQEQAMLHRNLRPHQRKLQDVKQSSVTRFKKPTQHQDVPDYGVIREEHPHTDSQNSIVNGTDFSIDRSQFTRSKEANYHQ